MSGESEGSGMICVACDAKVSKHEYDRSQFRRSMWCVVPVPEPHGLRTCAVGTSTERTAAELRVFYASLFGVFVVNIVLSMMHFVIGLWAVMAANNRYSSLRFVQAATGIFGVLGIAGLMPIAAVKTLYGTPPLYGYNAWLYLATAAVALYFAIKPGYRLTHIDIQQAINPHRTSA
jgi:hypothetical protein